MEIGHPDPSVEYDRYGDKNGDIAKGPVGSVSVSAMAHYFLLRQVFTSPELRMKSVLRRPGHDLIDSRKVTTIPASLSRFRLDGVYGRSSASSFRLVDSYKFQQSLFMTKNILAITISDELSGDVAAEILTRQQEMGRDPHELLDIVRTVHETLQELSSRAHVGRMQKYIAIVRE